MLLAEKLARRPDARAAQAFNFSNEIQVTVRELVDRILAADGLERSSPTSATRPATRSATSTCRAAKARSELGWAPLFTLDEGLARTIAWYRDFLEAPA